MKFSLEWLKQHLDTDASAEEIAEKLTAIGLEVEDLSNPAEALAPFRVAKVLTAEKHPQADKLQVLTVDAGTGEEIQIVCGAPNARAGMFGVFGPPGTYIPGSDITLKVAAIRGVESRGMMCSSRELELGEDHSGIIELPQDAPIGAAFTEYAGLDDPVFDVNVTPNRQDCMGVRGIARDLAAAGMGALKPLAVPQIEGSFPCPVPIRIEDPDGCPAFFGRAVRGVRNGASPDWMQRRLKAAGQRPISALVDITNYVMLEHGRPAHAYDIAKLTGGLTARAAKPGEKVLALNEKEYSLEPFTTVIADDRQVHDIGGIMGGEDSGVSEATTDVMLEVAYFTPERIARTGQALGLTSDARSRFERGVDPAFLDDGLAILTGLIVDICGGEPSALIRAGEPPIERRTIAFDFGRTKALSGIDVPERRQREILEQPWLRVRRSQRYRPDLAPRRRRSRGPRRGGRPHRGLRQGSVDAAEARSRRGEADCHAIAADGAARSTHGSRAWSGRGCDVELHFGRGGRRIRRRGLAARQSHQRGPEGHAPVAPARPDCGR